MDDFRAFAKPVHTSGLGPGCYVMTSEGELPVEWLQTGDKVITRDRGLQPIQWISRLKAGNDQGLLVENPVKLPLPDAGRSAQTDPLYLGPAHMVLLQSPLLETHFSCSEAMCRIADVSRRERVRFQVRQTTLTYHHLMLPSHALMMVNGLWVESLSLERAITLGAPLSAIQTMASNNVTAGPRILEPWEAKLIRVLTPAERNIRELLLAA